VWRLKGRVSAIACKFSVLTIIFHRKTDHVTIVIDSTIGRDYEYEELLKDINALENVFCARLGDHHLCNESHHLGNETSALCLKTAVELAVLRLQKTLTCIERATHQGTTEAK
jgi:hypothetical protein